MKRKTLHNKSPMNESVLCFQLLELLRRQSKLQKDFYTDKKVKDSKAIDDVSKPI